MTFIGGESREQELLLPERLEDYVGGDNPVRFIEAFVDRLDRLDRLDMAGCGFVRSAANARGRPSYDPRDLLKLYLYGYMNRTRSSRMLERACYVNLEAIWLMRKLRPDYKTIAEFRRRNPTAFKAVFRKFVILCRGMGLLGGDLVAVDGNQLKAVNNPKKNLTRNRLRRMIAQADERIEEYMKRMEREPGKYKRRGATVEKVFGTVKWAMGCESLRMKGLEKCQGEWSLMCACYNMKRAVSILGVEKLLEALEGAPFSRKNTHMAGVFAKALAKASSMPLKRVSNILGAHREQALGALFASAF